MAQDPSKGTNCILDSTGNNNHGTPQGTLTSDDLVDGLVGKALEFDGVDDGIDCNFNTNYTSITLEVLTKYTGTTESRDEHVLNKNSYYATDETDFPIRLTLSTTSLHYSLALDSGNDYNLDLSLASSTQLNNNNSNPYLYIAGINDSAGSKIFTDGDLDNTGSYITLSQNSRNWFIGKAAYGNSSGASINQYHCIINEVRISNVVRSADWIKTTNYTLRDDFVTLREPITFTLTDVYPKDNIKVYGLTQQLQARVTFSGIYDSYVYDASFYLGDGTYLSTISGTPSGQLIFTDLNTFAGTHYTWYLTASTSGVTRTSRVFEFDVRYLCSGICNTLNAPASGVRVHLHKRSTGELIGQTTTAGTGEFQFDTPYNEEHYVVALHPEDDYNALIYDKVKPN
jgi:hypothetical protein